MQALRMLLIYKQVTVHVAYRDVVLRVEGPFPDVQSVGDVEHRSAAEGGADSAGYRLDVVDGNNHRGLIGQSA
jgi:hypothetical protein